MGAIKRFCILVPILATSICWCQKSEAIPWVREKRLSWKDFKGKAPKIHKAVATTASGITYRFSSVQKGGAVEVDYTVDTFFYPKGSWYKANAVNDLILSHEQLHFDISELFARKMRQEMSVTTFTKNVKAEVRAIYKRTIRALKDFQNRYDMETDFSRNREKQLFWNKKISDSLK